MKKDDTISRQTAIDTLDKHLRTTDVPVSYPGIISALTEWLNELPSAQPDSKETSSTHKALDTISRQAAIDALMEFDKKLRKINWYQYPYTEHECRGVDEAIVKIANLPSAQPEIVRCKECAYASKDDYTHCPYVTWWNSKDDFCSKGKRRTDE